MEILKFFGQYKDLRMKRPLRHIFIKICKIWIFVRNVAQWNQRVVGAKELDKSRFAGSEIAGDRNIFFHNSDRHVRFLKFLGHEMAEAEIDFNS